MQNQLYSLSSLFSERLFRIPDYQRGYAWGLKELEEFWGDILSINNDQGHYTGVITLEDVYESVYINWSNDTWIINTKRFHPYYIVDGQQRLTTCIILIQSIIEASGDEELNFTSISDIRRKFIYDTMGARSNLRTYIFGYEKDNPSYEFLKRYIFCDDSEEHSPDQDTIYTANLENAKKFFEAQLKDMNFKDIERIYTTITQRLLFNVYSISNEVDVYIAFETMNNRGKPLSHLELLKNRLIYLSTRINSNSDERNKLRYKINEAWKAVYHYLGANKENPLSDDEFLFHHYTLYFRTDEIKRFVRYGNAYDLRLNFKDYILREKFGEENISEIDSIENGALNYISEYVESLKRSVEIWFKIMNPERSQFTTDEKVALKRIHRQVLTMPEGISQSVLLLILAAFLKTRNVDSRLNLINALERYNFISEILRSPYSIDIKRLNLVDMAIQLYRSNDEGSKAYAYTMLAKNNIEKWITEAISLPNFIALASKTFKGQGGFYNWGPIQYLLYEYEDFLREKSKNARVRIDEKLYFRLSLPPENMRDYHTIEHIYPQNPGRSLCWVPVYENYSQPQKKILRNSLGNLLALSQPKNSSLGNKCFINKKGSEGSNVGYKYGSYSEMQVAENDQWLPKDIRDRGLQLLDFIESRWGMKLGSRKEKINFLGLDFIK